MPEPFKNCFNKKIIRGMAKHFEKQWAAFDVRTFVSAASKDLEMLGLKERSEQITKAMVEYLPDDFSKAGEIMFASLSPVTGEDISDATVDADGIAGWAIMPMADYVGMQGSGHFDLSMLLLKEMTKRFSSEFGIRFFLLKAPEKTVTALSKWLKDEDRHVRRLISEGTRPRLPWAMRLPGFIDDPAPVISLLEKLKDDDDAYVRRSVANNLNDIAKDHPELVAGIAKRWMQGASKEREQLLRHACRSLIKAGHKKTLSVFGYGLPKLGPVVLRLLNPGVIFGCALQFELQLSSNSRRNQSLLIDYVVHHQKANGSTLPKVFKWRTATLQSNTSLVINKKHNIKPITTRVYYPGLHKLEVMVNGTSVALVEFQLQMP